MRSVTVLSRQGAASLAWDDAARLQQVADVRYHALEEAPGRAEATMLLRGTEILAATNACLPVPDAPLLATRLHLTHDRSRRLVHRATSLRGIELAGRTLGVVGVGRIGMRVARLADALGMRVVGTDIDEAAVALARGDGIAMADLSEVLAASDALVVCASHAYDAPAVLDHAELRSMRRGSLLVNVSRAALVDTAAAVAAVRAGWLRGYAVDDVVLDPAVDGDLLAGSGAADGPQRMVA